MAYPKPTKPTHEELRKRFLDVLRAADGGPLSRGPLRESIHPKLRAAELDKLAAELTAEGLIETEKAFESQRTPQRHNAGHWMIRYRLTPRGEGAAGGSKS